MPGLPPNGSVFLQRSPLGLTEVLTLATLPSSLFLPQADSVSVIYWNFKQGHGKYIWVSVSPPPHSYPWKTAPTDDRTSMEATTSGSQHPFPLSLGILHTEIPVTTTSRRQVTNKSKPLCYLWSTHQTLSILRWATCNLCIQDHYTLVSESEQSLTCHPLLLYFLVWEIHGNNFYG